MSNKEKRIKRSKVERHFAFLRWCEKYLFRIFFPYKRHGDYRKYDGPIIIVNNHYSFLDVVYPVTITDKPVHFIAKSQLWDGNKLLKKFVIASECIPAKRDGSDVQTVKDSLRILRAGGVISIFPEGTRNRSYDSFLPFHGGAAALSIKTQIPIIPIVKVTKTRIFRKTHVIFGEPVEFRQYYGKKVSREELDECDRTLHDAMWNMRLAFLDKNKKIRDRIGKF